MALVSQSIKNLKGGISQQPDILRYPDQGAAQVNGWSSETNGLQKRVPTTFIKGLGGQGFFGPAPLVHLINRDENERYYAVFTGDRIRVFELDGTERQVRGSFEYVTTNNPRDDLRMITVADYTFIVNKSVEVRENRGDLSTGGNFKDNKTALINVRGGQYGKLLKVNLNGTWVEHQLPDGSDPKQSPQTDAQNIAAALRDKLEAAFPSWTFSVGTGFVYIEAPVDATIGTLQTADGYADQLISPVTHYVQTFAKLPLNAPDGYIVKIVGDTSKTADQYYVKYDEKQKVWKETIGWNVPMMIVYESMPYTLVRAADGEFDFGVHTWDPRKAGDEDTSPMPSFVGGKITDVFFWRNRLGFLSGENVVLSRTGKYFDFFPPSVANLSDDDPIDVSISHNRVSILKYAIPFSEELLLWSDEAQFVMNASGVLSAKSVELNLTTQFDVQDGARPYGIGRNIYFSAKRATYSSINRYYAVGDVSEVKNAEDITAHVPEYIPNGVFSINGSGVENYASVLTTGAKNRIYLYKFLYVDEQIAQRSWSHWEFPKETEVLAADCIGSTMHIMMRNGTDCWLANAEFTEDTLDVDGEPYRVHVDVKKSYTIPEGKFNMDTNLTTLSLRELYDMDFPDGWTMSIVEPDGRLTEYVTGQPIEYVGDLTGVKVTVGFNYTFLYEFSKLLIKKTDPDGSTSTEDNGRLQLRRAWVNYKDSGQFFVKVNNGSREFSYNVGYGKVGTTGVTLGKPVLKDGQYRFPIAGNALRNAVTIESSSPTPLSIIGAGWEGNYARKSSGI